MQQPYPAGFVLPDTNLILFAALIVTGSFSVTLFNSTTDGLAIEITPEPQGTMVSGPAVGFIILSYVGRISMPTLPISWRLFKK